MPIRARRLVRALPLLILALSPFSARGTEGPPLSLHPGEQRVLRFPGLSRYSVSGAGVRALPLPSGLTTDPDEAQETLLLKATDPGSGDLWVWKKNGEVEHRPIRVLKTPANAAATPLDQALARLREAEVYRAGEHAILRGEVRSPAECSTIRALEQAFPSAVRDETRLGEQLARLGADRLAGWLAGAPEWAGRLRIEPSVAGPRVTGAVPETRRRDEARRQALEVFPCARVEIAALPDDSPTVYFRVFLLELRRERARSLGLAWATPPEPALQLTARGLAQSLRLDGAIRALEREGAARVLSNPELAVRAPGEAELFAGGELPVRAISRNVAVVNWKPFGLTLKLKVTHLAGDAVRVEILTEVSHLDERLTEDELPSLAANRMRTQVDARFGAPLLLSGLLQQKLRRTSAGLPALRSLPVLGRLFASEDYQQDRSELVAVLLPLREPPPPAPLDPEREPREAAGELPARLAARASGEDRGDDRGDNGSGAAGATDGSRRPDTGRALAARLGGGRVRPGLSRARSFGALRAGGRR